MLRTIMLFLWMLLLAWVSAHNAKPAEADPSPPCVASQPNEGASR